jgi:glycosyltransferase involved in cell wall biosynthesis
MTYYKKRDLMVSICCITYNQEHFIAQALEGFIMQQTNFEFEIVIGNDCSTDGTSGLLELFREKYPSKITVISNEKNMGCYYNFMNTLKNCKGKYIALCEGDDYWTDPHKLQKQVDFLEKNPDYVICCHYSRVINSSGETLYVHPNPVPREYTYLDLLAGRQEETKTASVVYHNIPEVYQLFLKPWYFNVFAADKILKLFATFNTGRKIYVMPEVMSCYRNHVGGIWSMIKYDSRMEMMISDFNLIIKQFSYPVSQKKRLLLLYVKRYLVFELRRYRMRKVYDTVKYLL